MHAKLCVLPVLLSLLAGCGYSKSEYHTGNDQAKGAQFLIAKNGTAAPAATQNAPKAKIQEIVINGVAGFQDTPMEPDSPWHVHDPARPQPPVVTPGTFSTLATPPSDAVALFNGTDLANWRDKRTGGPAPWKVEHGEMIAAKGDIQTTNEFGDVQLHVEFCEPQPGNHTGQDRGNSGVFLMGRYEIQVLDCYQAKTYADGATAALYGQHPALANACRPPEEWQTYDIAFTAPRFGSHGEVLAPGYVTVFYNGVLVQNHQAFRGDTNWRVPGKYVPHGPTGPLGLQFHNHPVRFRNIWARAIPSDTAAATTPPAAVSAPAAASPANPVGAVRPKRLLVVTTTTGFRHSSIPTAEKILAQLAHDSGEFTVDFVHQPPGQPGNLKPEASEEQRAAYKTAETAWEASLKTALQKLSPASLKHYDGVLFASTTGDLPIPDPQGLLDWIKAGHAFIGIHAASDTFHHWPGYIEMLGGEFRHHGRQVSVACLNQDPANPATAPLPATWTIAQEEIYQFTNYDAAKVHDLLILDQHPETDAPGHFGVSWCKSYGTGRVFYTSLGHREDIWDTDPELKDRKNSVTISQAYQAHVLGGIEWALGLKGGPVKP